MAEDTRAEDLTEDLREAFAQGIRAAVADLPAHHALQLADTLCTIQISVLAGKRVTYRATQQIDGAAITADWHEGLTIQQIVDKHGCSRRTAYNYHPQNVRQRRA